MTIDARKRRLTSILITKIGIPSKRLVLASLMEKQILENKHVTKIGLRQIEHAPIRVQIVKLWLMQFGSELNKPCFRFVLEEFLKPQFERFVLKGVRNISVGNSLFRKRINDVLQG